MLLNKEKYKIGITSGYYNPLHKGHIELLDDASNNMDFIFVIVNNDKQQILKKGKIIMDEKERCFIMNHIRGIDGVYLSIDEDETVCKTIEKLVNEIKTRNVETDDPNIVKAELEFYFLKGGDRSSRDRIPEADVCDKLGMTILYDVGSNKKEQSSTNINKLNGY